MTLSDKVLKLPTYAPEYKTLVALMSQRGDLIERTLIERFTHLTQRLNVSCCACSESAIYPLAIVETDFIHIATVNLADFSPLYADSPA